MDFIKYHKTIKFIDVNNVSFISFFSSDNHTITCIILHLNILLIKNET